MPWSETNQDSADGKGDQTLENQSAKKMAASTSNRDIEAGLSPSPTHHGEAVPQEMKGASDDGQETVCPSEIDPGLKIQIVQDGEPGKWVQFR